VWSGGVAFQREKLAAIGFKAPYLGFIEPADYAKRSIMRSGVV
jgi:hypothetical protein